MIRSTMIWGSLSMVAAVGLGAFGAHGLEPILTENGRVATWKTATDYHIYHAIALLVLGLLPDSRLLHNAGRLFMLGMIVFSGSLYLLSISNILWLGAITPIGGLAFIAGWVLMAIGVYKQKKP